MDLHYGDMFRDDPYVRMRFALYYGFLADHLRDGVRILDVGGYMGDMLTLLAQNFTGSYAYHLVDGDEAALAVAAQRGAKTSRMSFDREDLDALFPGETFDIILCTEVLEHLMDPHRHLAKIRDLLADDGVCVISLPNENTLFHRIMSLAGFGVDQCAFELYKHVHLPTIAQSRKFVSGYFHIEREEYYINVGMRGSRAPWLGGVLGLLPDSMWEALGRNLPGLFARGVVFKLGKAGGREIG
jgi:SAM-dependent methyltransferase